MLTPGSVEEVQELVAAHPRVKALGTRHSFTDIADSPDGVQISLEAMAPDIVVNADAATASVTAGTSYGVLARELESRGYALENMGSLPHISVGGAVATGTHGSGDSNGILSTSVTALELVQADGSLTRIDRSSPDHPALAVGLGAFGVVVRVELDIQPSFVVRQHVYRDADWDGVLEAFDEVMGSAYSVSLLGDVGGPTIELLWQKHRVERADDTESAPGSLHGGQWIEGSDLPSDNSLTTIGGIVGPWLERLPHFRLDGVPSAGGDELQSEYFVDRRHGVEALRAIRSMGERISPHLHAAEIRTVAADELWVSPAYRRDGVCIGFTWKKHQTEVGALLPGIEAALAPFEPRAHWGKLFTLTALSNRFPRLSDFLDLAATYDPDRKFWNPFLERLAAS